MTQPRTERISSPVVMGAIAALVCLGIALAVCIVPALAAQLGAGRSPLTVLGAVLLGLDALVLGHGGSLLLTEGAVEGPVRLLPLGLTAVLLLVAASAMRRMGRALSLVTAQGALRPGALRDAGMALLAFVGVHAMGGGVLASLARTPQVHAVSSTAVLGCAVVALVGGLAGLLWALRRREAPGVPAVRILDLLPAPYDAAARSTAISLLGLLAGAMLVLVGALAIALPEAASLMDGLDPGVVGGTVLLLLQLALMPTLALWVLAALLGGHFSLGVDAAVSLGSSRTGVLPALPLLAALPGPGDAPWYAWLLLALPIAALALGAVRVVRDVRGQDLRTRATAWGVHAAAVLVGTLVLLALAGGSIGSGRLRDLGPDLAATALPLAAMVLGTLGLVILVLDSPALDRARAALAGLRERVEREEAREGGATAAGATAVCPDGAADEDSAVPIGEDRVDGADPDAGGPSDEDTDAGAGEDDDAGGAPVAGEREVTTPAGSRSTRSSKSSPGPGICPGTSA